MGKDSEKHLNKKIKECAKSDFQQVITEDLIKSLDEIDITVRKSSRRFLDIFVEAGIEKLTKLWENNKIILKEKIRGGKKKNGK